MIIKTEEENNQALKRWFELKSKYILTYGKEWSCRNKQGNDLDNEIFELWDAIHQYDKTSARVVPGPRQRTR
jgi:hypothetical protein